MTSDLVFFVSAAYVLGMFVGVFAGMSANIVTKISGKGVVHPINAERDLVVLSSSNENEKSLVQHLKPRIEPVVEQVEEAEQEEAVEQVVAEQPKIAEVPAEPLPEVASLAVERAEPAAEEQVAIVESEVEAEEEEPLAAYDANNVQALRRMIQKKREMEAAESDQKRSKAA